MSYTTEELTEAEKTGEHVGDAELHRLKGELTLIQGSHEAEAEACFHQAIAIARHQQADKANNGCSKQE